VADTAVTARSSGRESYVPLGDAQRAPFWIAGTGMMSADTAVSAASSAARVACRPPAPAGAQRSEYVSDLQRPAVPCSEYVSVGNAGSGSIQVTAHEVAQTGPAVPTVTQTRRESPGLGDVELTTTCTMEMSTLVSGAGVLQPQLGKCSDSSGSVSTVHEFVYETDATVGSELLQPGQRLPPAYSQPGTQPPSQHGLPLTSSTPPSQPPVSSKPRAPALHVSASQDGQRMLKVEYEAKLELSKQNLLLQSELKKAKSVSASVGLKEPPVAVLVDVSDSVATQSTEWPPGITCSTATTMRPPLQPTAAVDEFADELDAVRRRQHDLGRSSTADTVPLATTAFLYPQQLQREAIRQAARPLRGELGHSSRHSQESSSTLADRRLPTPMTGYSALRYEAAPSSVAPSVRTHRSRRSVVSGQSLVVSAEVISVVHQVTDALLQVTNRSRDDAVACERLLLQQQQIMHRDLVEKDLQEKQISDEKEKKQMEVLADKEKKQMEIGIREKELLLKEKQLLAQKESKQMDKDLAEKLC